MWALRHLKECDPKVWIKSKRGCGRSESYKERKWQAKRGVGDDHFRAVLGSQQSRGCSGCEWFMFRGSESQKSKHTASCNHSVSCNGVRFWPTMRSSLEYMYFTCFIICRLIQFSTLKYAIADVFRDLQFFFFSNTQLFLL